MKLELFKEVKNPLIIEGFPGFGLVSTIATEYLINNLKVDLIGKIHSEKLPPMIAVHQGKLVEQMGIFYNEEFNVIFVYSMLNPKGLEWDVGDVILELAERTDARGIISMEGISKVSETGDQMYFFSTSEDVRKKFEELKIAELKDGIIFGITSTLLIKSKRQVDCIFVETNPELPDSLGAARLIEVLNNWLGFNIEVKPLEETAKMFESKIKTILEKSKQVKDESLNYVG